MTRGFIHNVLHRLTKLLAPLPSGEGLCAGCVVVRSASVLLILSLLAGCTTDHEEAPAVAQREISLATYISQPLATRADSSYMATNAIPTGKSIGVYAYYHENTTWAAADAEMPRLTEPNFMFNQLATSSGTGKSFNYSPVKYWPNKESDKLSFIAYYPYCNGADDDGSKDDIQSTGITPCMNNLGTEPYGLGLPQFRFSVNDDVKKQMDFMVSDLIPDLPYSRATDPNPGAPFNNLAISDQVRFNFKHATAKIEFRVTVDEDIRRDLSYFTLKSIQITNIYNEGLLTPTYNSGTGATTLTWSDFQAGNKTDYSCKTTEAYLLLPQTLRADAKLTIGYDLAFKSDGTSYIYDGSGNPVATEEYKFTNRSSSAMLNTLLRSGSEDALTEWLPNHHYIYLIRIGAHAIEFTGQVVDWGQRIAVDGIEVKDT